MNEPFTVNQILILHKKMIDRIGGSHGLREVKLLDSALAQPFMTFDGNDLHPTVLEKAAVLGYSLVRNHPFIDGNKRVAHAATELFLRKSGYRMSGTTDEHVELFLRLASSEASREDLLNFLICNAHLG